jgi:hypothetical protein
MMRAVFLDDNGNAIAVTISPDRSVSVTGDPAGFNGPYRMAMLSDGDVWLIALGNRRAAQLLEPSEARPSVRLEEGGVESPTVSSRA